MGKPKKARAGGGKKKPGGGGGDAKKPPSSLVAEVAQNEVSTSSAEALADQAEVLLQQGDFNEARKLFVVSLEKRPDQPEVMFSLASCLLELDRPEEARQYLVRSCELSPDCQPEKWLSLAELEEGKRSLRCLEKAAAILQLELAAAPMDEDSVDHVGESIADNVDNKENLKQACRRKLSNVYVCISELFTTDLCDEENAEEMVVSSIGKALELDPSNPEAVQAKAAYHLIKSEFAMAAQEMKRSLDMWLPAFTRAVEGGLEDADQIPPFNVRLSAVKLLLELELLDEATTVLDGLVLEDEDCIDVWYLLGWTNYMRSGDFLPNAKFYLKKAAEVASQCGCDDKSMTDHIQELLEELKEVESEEEEDDDDEGWETTEEDEGDA